MIENFKKAFFKDPTLVHLNNAGLSPIPKSTKEMVNYWADRFYREGVFCNDPYMEAVEVARRQLAALAGAQASEICFFQSTAGAVSQVAFGMDLKQGDEIVIWDQEYGSNFYPWKAACELRGATLKVVQSPSDLSAPLEKLLEAVTSKTRVIAVSWVQYQTGSVTDLKALSDFARARGIWTVVDVIQGLGARPFNFAELGIDFACGGSHKWMCSPVGAGFLISKLEHVQKLRPLTIGMATYGTCEDTSAMACIPKKDAHRFESGSRQVLEITGLGASAKFLQETGIDLIQKESERLGNLFREGLKDLGYLLHHNAASSGAFITFTHKEHSPKVLGTSLWQHRIALAYRGPGLRLSTHAHNSEGDITKALEVLKNIKA